MEKELEVTCLSCGHEFTIGEDEVYEDDMDITQYVGSVRQHLT